MSGSRPGVHLSGFGLAILAFSLTRLYVAGTAESEVEAFVFAELVPLSAGLGLTLFGVAIGVGAVTRSYARTVWRWAALGTFAMVLVLVATALHTVFRGQPLGALWEQSGVLIANALLGGAILGTIVGDRSARHRRTNERLVQYAERSMLVNRLLRHEILNAVAIVRGYANTSDDQIEDSTEAIRESTDEIERTVDHVTEFASTTGDVSAVDVTRTIEDVLAELPDTVDVSIASELPEDALVRADDRLGLLVGELLENAIEHGGENPAVELAVTKRQRTVDLTVRDDGPGLPERAESALAARTLPRYDDPSLGYGLQMVRLLVEQYDGTIDASDADGAAVTVTLQRTRPRSIPQLALGVPTVDLYRVGFAAVLAGIVMGLLLDQLAGIMSVVGTLYGIESPAIGWVSHLFHSVVFGLLFAAGCTLPRIDEVTETWSGTMAVGVAWGVVLWVVAAGVVLPIWMMAVGLDAMLPNLSPTWLVGHVVWGAILGGCYAIVPGEELLPE